MPGVAVMDLIYFLKGFLVGVIVAVPVGPISILCIQRTLARGRAAGIISWSGMATGDALYASIAVFGLTFLSDGMTQYESQLQLAGAMFLVLLGVRTYRKKAVPRGQGISTNRLLRYFTSTVFLTLTNPFTIIAFAALFAGFGVGDIGANPMHAGQLVLGVLCGSSSWGFFLSAMFNHLRSRFTEEGFRHLNHVSGIVIVTLGLALAISMVV
jgi:threonine/homoserine/homoserine lactone efflux protein